MKRFATLIITAFIAVCVTQGQELLKKLEDGFASKDAVALQNFVADWKQKAGHETDKQDAFSKDVHELYASFFDPFNLNKICGVNTFDSIYNNTKNILIQNKVTILITWADTLKQQSIKFTDSIIESKELTNFSPKLEITESDVLYLTREYKKALLEFLTLSSSETITDIATTTARMAYISPLIKVLKSPMGDAIILETQPYVNSITFNRKRNLARIDFQILNQGGSAYYIKNANQWSLIWSGLTWKD